MNVIGDPFADVLRVGPSKASLPKSQRYAFNYEEVIPVDITRARRHAEALQRHRLRSQLAEYPSLAVDMSKSLERIVTGKLSQLTVGELSNWFRFGSVQIPDGRRLPASRLARIARQVNTNAARAEELDKELGELRKAARSSKAKKPLSKKGPSIEARVDAAESSLTELLIELRDVLNTFAMVIAEE